jgi:hypothetical protein
MINSSRDFLSWEVFPEPNKSPYVDRSLGGAKLRRNSTVLCLSWNCPFISFPLLYTTSISYFMKG